jgi:hypothetical protein
VREEDHLIDADIYGKIILDFVLNKYNMACNNLVEGYNLGLGYIE